MLLAQRNTGEARRSRCRWGPVALASGGHDPYESGRPPGITGTVARGRFGPRHFWVSSTACRGVEVECESFVEGAATRPDFSNEGAYLMRNSMAEPTAFAIRCLSDDDLIWG